MRASEVRRLTFFPFFNLEIASKKHHMPRREDLVFRVTDTKIAGLLLEQNCIGSTIHLLGRSGEGNPELVRGKERDVKDKFHLVRVGKRVICNEEIYMVAEIVKGTPRPFTIAFERPTAIGKYASNRIPLKRIETNQDFPLFSLFHCF